MSDPYIFDGAGASVDGNGTGAALFISNTTYSFVIRNWGIFNCSTLFLNDYNPGAGIVVYNCSGTVQITNNNPTASRLGIYSVSCTDLWINNNTFSNDVEAGSKVLSSSGVVFDNNTATACGIGISMNQTSASMVKHNFLSSNSYGIFLDHTSGTTVKANTCNSNSNSGIVLTTSNDCQVMGNTCDLNTGTVPEDAGISLQGTSSNDIVTSNYCRLDANGIYASPGTQDGSIVLNDASSSVQSGIRALGSRLAIENNSFQGNGLQDISASGGSQLIIKNNTCMSTGILVSSASNPIVADNLVSGPGGMKLMSLSLGQVSGNRVEGSGIFAISLDTCQGVNVHNNIIKNAPVGISVLNSAATNYLNLNSLSNLNQGIILRGGPAGSQVLSNTITNGQGASSVGIQIHGSDHSVIRGNTLTNCGLNGIQAGPTNHTTILDNNITGNALAGILLEGLDKGIDNLVRGNTVGANTVGIRVEKASNYLISGNKAIGNIQAGIFLTNTSNNLVSANNCSQTGDLAFLGDGVRALNSHDTLSDNTCWSNLRAGMSMEGGTVNIHNNLLSYNQIGLLLRNGTGSVEDNRISRSTAVGLSLLGESGLLVQNNLITSNTGFGIDAASCTGLRVQLNILTANNGATATFNPAKAQARDDGALDHWNSSARQGNLWSDWKTPDADRDGIVDVPYAISGGAQDLAPLSSSIGPVTGLHAIAGNGYIQLHWGAPNYTAVGPLSNYQVVRKVDGVIGPPVLTGGAASLNDTSVIAWTTYSYFVYALNAYGSSVDASISVGVTDVVPPALTIIYPVTGTRTNLTSFTAQWSGVDAVSGISHFNVTLDTVPKGSVGTATTYALSNLAQGPHSFKIEAWDNAGNKATNTTNFVVDSFPPQIVIDAPLSGTVLNVNSVTVSWTGSDNGTGVDRYEARLDSGPWSALGTAQSVSYSNLAQGDHVVSVRAFDGAGNSAFTSVAFRVDSEAPVVHITSPASQYLRSQEVLVTWTMQKNGTGALRSQVRVDGGLWIMVASNTSILITLADGPHHVEVMALDAANNSGNASVSFTVDTSAPQVTILSPTDGSWVNTQRVMVVWNGSDATSGLAWFEVRVDNGTWGPRSLATQYQTPALSEGNHSVEVRAFDLAGNNASVISLFRLDSVQPQFTWISPSYGALLNITTITFRWNASDAYSGLNRTTVTMDGGVPIDVGMDTNYTATNLSEGLHAILVQVYDNAQNVRAWSSRVLVDLTPPLLDITEPQNGTIIQSRSVIVSWVASDNGSGMRTIYGKLDGGSWEDWALAQSYHLVNPPPAGMTEGHHTVYVKAWDNAGNYRIRTVNFTVDVTAPVVQITSPLQNSWTNQTSILVTWTGSNYPTGMDHYEVRLDGANWTVVGLQTSMAFSNLTVGAHTVEVKGVGNTSQSTTTAVNFGVDQTPPSGVTIDPPVQYSRNGTVHVTWQPASDSPAGILHYEAKITKTYWNGARFVTVNGTWFNSGPGTSLTLTNNADGEYNISIRAVDRAGNIGPASGVNQTLDSTPPSILSYAPLGQVATITPQVTILFSEAMDQATVHVSVVGVSGSTNWSGNLIVYTPDTALTFNQTYTVSVSGKDLAGNSLPAYEWTFRTIPNIGTIQGKVVNGVGSPISGAIVRLENGQTTATDKNGGFSLIASGGAHTLTVQVKGFADKVMNVTIAPGLITNLGQMQIDKAPSDYSWVIALTFVLLIGVAAELLYLQQKKKKK